MVGKTGIPTGFFLISAVIVILIGSLVFSTSLTGSIPAEEPPLEFNQSQLTIATLCRDGKLTYMVTKEGELLSTGGYSYTVRNAVYPSRAPITQGVLRFAAVDAEQFSARSNGRLLWLVVEDSTTREVLSHLASCE